MRSALIAGSISEFGKAMVSKWDIEEPCCSGRGAKSRALLFGLAPLTNVRSERPGVSVSAFCSMAGVAPGTRLIRL